MIMFAVCIFAQRYIIRQADILAFDEFNKVFGIVQHVNDTIPVAVAVFFLSSCIEPVF